MKKFFSLLIALSILTFAAGPALAADPIVFDRGLPIINLNNAAGASRSNVAWSNGNDYVSGDDFTIGQPGEKWVVTGIRTWSIGMLDNLSNEFSDVKLYTGSSGIAPVSSIVTPTSVTYVSGLPYQSTGGSDRKIWQLDFTGLNWNIDGGTKYYFAVDGAPIPASTGYQYWFNHASNAVLSESTQNGSDGKWLVWERTTGLTSNPLICDSGAPVDEVCNGGWDKSSDINVQVFAHKVPAKVEICHLENKKLSNYHLISVSEDAVMAHRNHGDGLPGELVPKQTGKIFAEDCSIWTLMDTVQVNPTGAIFGSFITRIGKTYRLEASGTYKFANWGQYGIADAKFNHRSPAYNGGAAGWVDGSTWSTPYKYYLQVKTDTSGISWIESYNDAHIYTASFAGDGSTIHFQILDDAYGDNSGYITVKIFEKL